MCYTPPIRLSACRFLLFMDCTCCIPNKLISVKNYIPQHLEVYGVVNMLSLMVVVCVYYTTKCVQKIFLCF